MERTVEIGGVHVPRLAYGTAWKEERTAPLVREALAAGFRGIDTANQRKHYFEAAVGEAIRASGIARDELWLQTKFTFRAGQDHRLPYDPGAPIAAQVEQSFASSREHLGVTELDSYVLHGPSVRFGLAEADWEAWRAMEGLHAAGKTRLLGVSNVSAPQLDALLAGARVKPALVQNRCYAARGWDRAVRSLCAKHGILYQAFSLLTGNPEVLGHPVVAAIARRVKRTPAEVVFRFALQAGMVALTGTTSREHMAQDLSVFEWSLADADVATLDGLVSTA